MAGKKPSPPIVTAPPCCANHDRMDLLLNVLEYNDYPCGTPTNPTGERRFCCAHCPSFGKPIEPREEWHDNPLLWVALSEADHQRVMQMNMAKRVHERRVSRKLTT